MDIGLISCVLIVCVLCDSQVMTALTVFRPIAINGFGQISQGIYFVELKTIEPLSDFSKYTISADNTLTLPSTTLAKGMLILLSNNITYADDFMGKAYPNSYPHSKKFLMAISMAGGNDGVEIKEKASDLIIDKFGPGSSTKDACKDVCGYGEGWVHRRSCAGPKEKYATYEWSVAANAFSLGNNPFLKLIADSYFSTS